MRVARLTGVLMLAGLLAGSALAAEEPRGTLAPTTVMWWQPVPLLHAAVLTFTLAASAFARVRPPVVTVLARSWTVLAVAFALLLAFGGPRHRCGGRSNIVIPLRHDHPMLYDLGIHASCRVPIQPDGWWPDVLPER